MPGFLKLFLSGKLLCVCVYVYVRPPGYNHSCENEAYISNQTSSTAFLFLCMALAINTSDGRGFSNEAHHELLPKKNKVMLYLLFIRW